MTPEQRIAEAINEPWCWRECTTCDRHGHVTIVEKNTVWDEPCSQCGGDKQLPDIGQHNVLRVIDWTANKNLFSQNLPGFLSLREAYERLLYGITDAAQATAEIIKIIAQAIREN